MIKPKVKHNIHAVSVKKIKVEKVNIIGHFLFQHLHRHIVKRSFLF